MRVFSSDIDSDALVEQLGVEHRAKQALRRLMALGSDATESLRRGLCHPDATVRVGCCKVLDHRRRAAGELTHHVNPIAGVHGHTGSAAVWGIDLPSP